MVWWWRWRVAGAAALHFNNNNLITFALEIVRWNTKDEMRVRGNSKWTASWVDIGFGARPDSLECNRKKNNVQKLCFYDFIRSQDISNALFRGWEREELVWGRCAVNHCWIDGGKWKWQKRTAICSNKCQTWQRTQTHTHIVRWNFVCVDLTFLMTISSR